ncbi:MAG: MFS transporter [Myxococcota bacterium]
MDSRSLAGRLAQPLAGGRAPAARDPARPSRAQRDEPLRARSRAGQGRRDARRRSLSRRVPAASDRTAGRIVPAADGARRHHHLALLSHGEDARALAGDREPRVPRRGGIGQLGNPLGARLSNLWGRRPTSVAGAFVAVVAGILFYWVPAGPSAVVPLMALIAASQGGIAALSVSDRLIGTEPFPTALRATFMGASALMQAGAAIAAQFGLSLLATPLGGLAPAISWLSAATFVPAIIVFLMVVPETRGLSLERAALEDEPAPK